MYEMANCRGPGAVYKYWAWYGGSGFGWPPRRAGGERVAGSLLASGLHQAVRAVLLFGPRLWQSFIRCSLWFNSGYILRQSTAASVGGAVLGQGALALRCAMTGAGSCPDIPVVVQRQFPMVQLFIFMVQFSDKVVEVPVVVQRQVTQSRSCSSPQSLTPLFLRSG